MTFRCELMFFAMRVVGLRDVDGCQHREDERLQRDDEDMENRPAPLQRPSDRRGHPTDVHERDKYEDHFAGIEVAEQAQAQRKGFGKQRHRFQQKIDRRQEFREGLKRKFADEAANTFLFDAEEDHERKHKERHAHGDIGVGGRHNFHVGNAYQVCGMGQEVHWHQVHEVHQEHPDENGERQGRDHGIGVVKDVLHQVVDEINDGFNEVLQAAWDAGCRSPSGGVEDCAEDDTEHNRPADRIDMHGHETHVGRFFSIRREPPCAIWMPAIGQVGEVVANVFF